MRGDSITLQLNHYSFFQIITIFFFLTAYWSYTPPLDEEDSAIDIDEGIEMSTTASNPSSHEEDGQHSKQRLIKAEVSNINDTAS